MKKENIHYAPKYFINPTHPITVLVIGCGGTGSLLIPRLARLDYVLKELGHPGLHVKAYDGDVIEKNNVGRQNFNANDIGENKAFNIIQKVNLAFGLDWDSGGYFSDNEKFFANIFITCVDNVKTRKDISSINLNSIYYDYSRPFYWIDCGNGKDFGQVVLSTLQEIKQPEESMFNTISTLPSVFDIFGELSDYDNEETQGIGSCSMAESLSKQDIFINDEIAIQAVKILQKLIRNFRINYSGAIVNQETCKVLPLKIN